MMMNNNDDDDYDNVISKHFGTLLPIRLTISPIKRLKPN